MELNTILERVAASVSLEPTEVMRRLFADWLARQIASERIFPDMPVHMVEFCTDPAGEFTDHELLQTLVGYHTHNLKMQIPRVAPEPLTAEFMAANVPSPSDWEQPGESEMD